MMKARPGIRTKLLLASGVFLAIPWLGYEYAREIESLLRQTQQQTLLGTAQAVATALNDRPALFDAAKRGLPEGAPLALARGEETIAEAAPAKAEPEAPELEPP